MRGRVISHSRFSSLVLALTAGMFIHLPSRAQDLWLAPPAAPFNTPLHRADDLMNMFNADAPWKEAAAHVKVFQLPASYLGHAPQPEIDQIVADLKRRHIPLALEVGVMNVGPKATNPVCGGFGQVEGYGTPEWAKSIAQKIKRAGGALEYIAMDEPLFYGHYFKGRPGGQPGCRSAVDAIVGLVVAPLGVFIAEFPDVVIGDIEPTDIAEQPGWREDLVNWVAGFRKTMGREIAFVHLDIPFTHPREEAFALDFFKSIEALKRQKAIGAVGIIYDGLPTDTSDATWTANARSHVLIMEDKYGLRPDHAVIQSWMEYPKLALPDTSPTSLTGLVNFYARRARR